MYDKLYQFFQSYVRLNEEEWNAQSKFLSVKTIKKNQHLIKAGMVCTEMNFINKGTFRTYQLINGKELTSNFFFAGSFTTDYISLINKSSGSI